MSLFGLALLIPDASRPTSEVGEAWNQESLWLVELDLERDQNDLE